MLNLKQSEMLEEKLLDQKINSKTLAPIHNEENRGDHFLYIEKCVCLSRLSSVLS